MEIEFEKKLSAEKEVYICKIKGRLTAAYTKLFEEQLKNICEDNKYFVFDLSLLEFIDSTGLGSLIKCVNKIKQQNGKTAAAAIQPKTAMVFEITRAYKIIKVFNTVPEALRYFENEI